MLAIGDGERHLLDTIDLLPDGNLRVYLDWGRDAPRDPRDGTDVAATGRRLYEALTENGYVVTGREWADSPDDRYLVDRLRALLKAWFPR